MGLFLKANSSIMASILFFVVSLIGGHIIAVMAAKTKDAQQTVTGSPAVAVFLLLFFGFSK